MKRQRINGRAIMRRFMAGESIQTICDEIWNQDWSQSTTFIKLKVEATIRRAILRARAKTKEPPTERFPVGMGTNDRIRLSREARLAVMVAKR